MEYNYVMVDSALSRPHPWSRDYGYYVTQVVGTHGNKECINFTIAGIFGGEVQEVVVLCSVQVDFQPMLEKEIRVQEKSVLHLHSNPNSYLKTGRKHFLNETKSFLQFLLTRVNFPASLLILSSMYLCAYSSQLSSLTSSMFTIYAERW